MNQLEQFREQCAAICDEQHDRARTSSGAARALSCADAIRALPLPEDQTKALQKTLDSLSKRCYIMSESHQINDMVGARLIIGFNDILDAGDAHQAIVTIKKRGSMTSFNKLIETDSKYKIDLPRAVIQPSKSELKTEIEALRKENEQLKYMVGLDKNDPIPEWEMIEPTFWKGANLTVIGDRHLPNGRRQHLVKETSGELREFGNADIFYSEGVK